MNINMENKIVRFLLDGADLTNGCSVVRRALWRSAQCVALGFVGLFMLAFVCFVLGGSILYLCSPWFGQFDIGLSLSWLGNSWWAELFRLGANIGAGILVVGTILAAFFGLLFFIFAAKEGKIQPLNKVIAPIAEGTAVVTDAVMAFGHRFCPKIDVQWPTKFAESGLVEGALVKLDEYNGDVTWKVTGAEFTKDKERIRVVLEDIDPSRSSWHTYYLMFTIAGGYFGEGFEILPETPVEEEVSPA